MHVQIPHFVVLTFATLLYFHPCVGVSVGSMTATRQYKNLIFPQFRVLVTEYLQSTHLTVYDARFKYDPFFGAGLYSSFTRFVPKFHQLWSSVRYLKAEVHTHVGSHPSRQNLSEIVLRFG